MDMSMDWFKGKLTGTLPYLLGKSMVSGLDFPSNQSIEHIIIIIYQN